MVGPGREGGVEVAEVAELVAEVGEEGWGKVSCRTPPPANTTKYYAYLQYQPALPSPPTAPPVVVVVESCILAVSKSSIRNS